MKIKRHQLLTTCLFSTLFVGPVSYANKKTVGDLLTQAQGNKSQKSKSRTALPDASLGFKEQGGNVNLDKVKPPKSSEVMRRDSADGNKAEYERILNQQIQELYKLTQQMKNSKSRGELWLRLAELYVEKAGLIDSRKQDEYDARLREFLAGKTNKKPILNTDEAREYNKKAVQLYEWFQRDFPRDEKIAQALFFLGYNYFELGEINRGAKFYEELTQRFPNSQFISEAHFALAEYYFDNEKWESALKEYNYIIKDSNHRLNTFALYKAAWCLFRTGHAQKGMGYLEYIIKTGRNETGDKVAGQKVVNRSRLETEALRDIVAFYAEVGDPANAQNYFKNIIGGKSLLAYLERLAYQYADRGNKEAARDIFKLLISQDPNAPKAVEYQYQIVQNFYYAKNTTRFKDELYKWVIDFDTNSGWYAQNKSKPELIESSTKLRETTFRNYILQQHQTAQNSRAQFSQTQAFDGYNLYFKVFPQASSIGDMHFYFGELLFDMQRYDEAAAQYKWVIDHAQNSKFYEQATQNLVLAVERMLPSDQEMQKNARGSSDPIPFDAKTERVLTMCRWYIEKFPRGAKTPEIKFRVARLYYQSNQFDEALKLFTQIVKEGGDTKYCEYSANLILDIYNIKKDYAGLEKAARDLLNVPSIASTKAGAEIRAILEKASFKKGQDLEVNKNYSESAKSFEMFASLNPNSTLASAAMFNAAVNYERAGMPVMAIGAYQNILKSKDPAAEKYKPKARRLLAKQYQDSVQFEEAAKLYKEVAHENPTDPLAPNMIFNAAVLYEALGMSEAAVASYTEFTKTNKKQSENIEVVFSLAQIHRKAGQTNAAINRYLEYVEGGGHDPEKMVESSYWIQELYKKQRAITKSKEWAQKTIAIQKRLAGTKKKVGASYAAKLRLEMVLDTFREMKAITFPRDPARQKAAVNNKINLLTKLAGELAEVIKYDSAEEIVTSLTILGEANLNMANAIKSAPFPAGLNAEETKQYQAGVEKFAEPFISKGNESFKLAVERGWELEVYNDSYKAAFEHMNKLDAKTYYNGGEVSSDMHLVNWIGGQ